MSDANSEEKIKAYHKKAKKQHFMLKVLIFTIFSIVAVTFGISTIISIILPKSKTKFMGRIITSIGFALLGFTFAFYGFKILRKLKFAFHEFYAQNRKKLIFATLGLSIPMMMRSICDLLIVVSPGCY